MGILSFFCCTRNKSLVLNDHSKPGVPPDSKPAANRNAGKPEPYSEGHARQLFKTYEDPDTPGEIGPEGFEKLCTDLDISLEGPLPLVLAWQMHAAEMARFKEAEWLKGTGELRCVLLLLVELLRCYWGRAAIMCESSSRAPAQGLKPASTGPGPPRHRRPSTPRQAPYIIVWYGFGQEAGCCSTGDRFIRAV